MGMKSDFGIGIEKGNEENKEGKANKKLKLRKKFKMWN